ncbi:MAG: ATP-dependent DNA helicase RecG [Lachnospiraceae bacterium]|nr:ATP-dependent DNA helicase RecG [Lachnospiraceae bacterium]
MQLSDSVRKVKGVGEKAERCLNKLNIGTVGDLLEHYPRGYDEFKPLQPVASLREGEIAAVEGTLSARPQMRTAGRLKILTVTLQDESGSVLVTWFNMPFLRNQLKMGTRYIFRGKIARKSGRIVMEQPKMYTREEYYRQAGRLRPVYPLTAGITNNAVTKAVETALKETEDLQEYLPAEIRKRRQLTGYKKALQQIHFPENKKEMREGRRRLVFDELFLYSLALAYIKKSGAVPSSHVMEERPEAAELLASLPFDLTGAQQKVLEEIMQDMKSGYVMNRLVQGDVGSGKTIVAVLALYQTVLNGGQGAFMVPTEVLASQHYKSLCGLLSDRGVRIGLLTGSLTAKQKREGQESLAAGEWDIVVGTHAIIQDKVEFANLALVITDEQHRFGVKQRESLFQKGKEPHVLAMSATPIPRTLALILYGDMDLSVIDERPANRLPIKNCVVNTAYRPNAYKFMKEQIDQGRQVYIICPMVEESEESELENVTIYTEELRGIFPASVRIDNLHGRMKPQEKEEIMERFARGDTDILVSTTVIEVGIDVPNATVIMIENAERFGLAQLHQLRGRVGRGKEQSYCILMTGQESEDSRERLSVLAESNDGFYIAREDLKLRGQGDLFGIRQSGDQIFALADIFEDAAILKEAGEEAKTFTGEEITLLYQKNKRLRNRVERYLGQVTL